MDGAEYGIVEVTALLAKAGSMVVEYHDVPGRGAGELAAHLHEACLGWGQQRDALPNQGQCAWVQPAVHP